VTDIDPGFRPERVIVMEVSPPASFSLPAQRSDLFARVLEELQAVPGVESAGAVDDLFHASPREQLLTVQGKSGTISERLRFTRDEVAGDFFSTLGTPLLRGRFFSIADRAGAPPVAIVNEAMARRSWPGHDPVGRRIKFGAADSGGAWYTVVGVVGDMRRQGLEREALPQIFVSLAQGHPPQNVALVIRTASADPLTMAGALRAAVRRVDRNAATFGVAPLDQQFGTYLAQRRFQTSLLTGFSMVALLMAAVGIYGLIQYSITARTQEIGLRMAVGAQAGDIFRMVIGEGLTLGLIGVAIGLVGARWLARAGSSLLLGVTAGDPWTFTTVSLLLTAVAAAACYFPARRAMSLDPLRALRLM
jgi:putative ABC transport system permease protein